LDHHSFINTDSSLGCARAQRKNSFGGDNTYYRYKPLYVYIIDIVSRLSTTDSELHATKNRTDELYFHVEYQYRYLCM
jgi:hypothetical protein